MELNGLLTLNEEMQSIWSEKDSEVHEVLEKFSAYRDAIETDSKEKDEMYTEELNKRTMIVNELELSKKTLEEQLARKDKALQRTIKDIRQFEATRLQQFLEIEKLVTVLSGNCGENENEAKTAYQTISDRLQSAISTFMGEDFKKYTGILDVAGQDSWRSPDVGSGNKDRDLSGNRASAVNEGDLTTGLLTGWQEKQNSNKLLEDNGLRITDERLLLSEGVRKQLVTPTENIRKRVGIWEEHAGCYEMRDDQFQDDDRRDQIGIVGENGHSSLQEGFFNPISATEMLEEDLTKMVKRIEEEGVECERNANDEEDGLMEAYVERKTVVKLLEEQWTRYQLLCKEKDDELRHWKRKHKQDTKDLQDILEDQEKAEAKNREALTELQAEIDKLRRRNKALEFEVEMAKEQGEDEVCVLRDNFQKDLTSQLRRQSQSFLSVEVASRCEVEELEKTNEELSRANDDLRRQIADHCMEIKTWVTDVLLLTEEEYSEEFHTISDVLAKLQEMIAENERTINNLRGQLIEYKDVTNGRDSPTDDFLSHSWGGQTGNSMDSQKESCRNCRQTKWRRALMGSFDLEEAGLAVKQDEIENYVAKIDINEPKYRKKHSLKDSLELADAQIAFIRRLDEQNSLEIVSEDSLEENSVSGSVLKGLGSISSDEDENKITTRSSDVGRSTTPEDNSEKISKLQACRVGSRTVAIETTSAPEERDGSGGDDLEGKRESCEQRKEKNTVERDGKNRKDEEGNGDVELRRNAESEVLVDMWDEEGDEVEEDDDEEDNEEEDLVRVVNLYRSLVVDGGNLGLNTNVKASGDVKHLDTEGDLIDLGGDVFDNGELPRHGMEDIFVYQDSEERKGRYETCKRGSTTPDQVVEKDCTENLPEVCTNGSVENESIEISSGTKTPEDVKIFESFNPNECLGLEEQRELKQRKMKEEKLHPNEPGINEMYGIEYQESFKEKKQTSESLRLCENSEKSLGEFLGNNRPSSPNSKVRDDTEVSTKSCSHCSRILIGNAPDYARSIEKSWELKSQQAKDGSQISREVEETKAEVKRYQQQYEDLEKVCEDYQKRIDEYSENVRKKSTELRKLKLSSSVLRTEVDWLRQALGITRNCGLI